MVRWAYEAWNRRNFDRILELADPEIDWTFAPSFPREPWDQLNVEVHELRGSGDTVVALIRVQAVAHGLEVDQHDAHVFTFRGSRVIRFEAFPDPKEALEAAGLSE